MQLLAVQGDQAAGEVDLQRAVPEGRLGGLVRTRAAERRAGPGEQLLHGERLGHVVVGPGVERRDLVRLRLTDRKDDHGDV